MKTYYIKCGVNVSIDDWNEGQGENVNYWDLKATVGAETPIEAIKTFFDKNLYWSFDEKQAYIEPLELGENCLEYSNYVDENNLELSENSQAMQDFRAGTRKVFVADSLIKIFEIVPVAINI